MSEEKKEIVITLCSSDLYSQHLGVTIASVMKSKNADEYIKIYIIDGGITENNKARLNSLVPTTDGKIIFITPDIQKVKDYNTGLKYVSNVTYYRLLLAELLENEDKVLYMDCDIIVRTSLHSLYEKDFNDNYILGVEDIDSILSAKRLGLSKYINSGILLLNLKQIREQNYINKSLEWAKNNYAKIERCDQDIINAVYTDKISYIEDIYNTQVIRMHHSRFDEIKDPVIIHFISSQKPWTYWKPLNSTHWSKEYFKILKKTPWKNFAKEYKIKSLLIFPLRIFYPTGIVKRILNNIFSVRNSDDKKYKIVTFFGLKKRFTRNKVTMQGKIIVCYHNLFRTIFRNEILLPIHLGKDLSNITIEDIACDNTGDNISYKNKIYNEQTGLYWLWKNIDTDYYGLFHYRRFLDFKNKYKKQECFSTINVKDWDNKTVSKLLTNYDIILPTPFKIDLTLYDSYKETHVIGDLDVIIDLIKKYYPEYVPAMATVLNKKEACYCNMFVMKKEMFREYCSWLFDILEKSEEFINLDNRDDYQKRTYGFIPERMLNIFVEYQKQKNPSLKIKYCKTIFINNDPIKSINLGLFKYNEFENKKVITLFGIRISYRNGTQSEKLKAQG